MARSSFARRHIGNFDYFDFAGKGLPSPFLVFGWDGMLGFYDLNSVR